MPGSSFYVSFNGRRFALPEDLDPQVTMGGLTNKAPLRNGEGTVDFQKTTVPGAVRGLAVRLRLANGDLEALNALAGREGVSMVFSGPDGVFAGVGGIIGGDDGIKMGQQEGKSEEFDFICANGQKLERR